MYLTLSFQINSPVRLSSEPAASEEVPYLSLQPPPGRQLEGVVQFEDLDLYMWPSARYQTPSLLFYAGPIRFPEQQNGTEPDTREVCSTLQSLLLRAVKYTHTHSHTHTHTHTHSLTGCCMANGRRRPTEAGLGVGRLPCQQDLSNQSGRRKPTEAYTV